MKKFPYMFTSKEFLQKIKYLFVFFCLLAPLVFCIFLNIHPVKNQTGLAVSSSTMYHTNVIGTSVLFAAFFLEFFLILLHRPDRKW